MNSRQYQETLSETVLPLTHHRPYSTSDEFSLVGISLVWNMQEAGHRLAVNSLGNWLQFLQGLYQT